MTREEAIERIKVRFDKWALDDEDMKAIQTLIPEFSESEDERIIKTLQEYVKNRNWMLNGPTQGEVLAWLERQKECLADNNKTSTDEDERIRKSLIEFLTIIKGISESGRTTWAVREDDAEMCKSSIAYLEKQKDASKAIEAVDRIDNYIDENVTNAHDMKDSLPDKKYCQGIDDTLADIARILQDVYSGEKQKEPQPVEWEWPNLSNCIKNCKKCHGKCFYRKEPYEEQKPEKWSDDEMMCKRAITILKLQRDFWSYDGPMDKFPPATPRKDLVDALDIAISYLEKNKEEEGYEAIPAESTLEYKLGFKAGKESEKQKEQKDYNKLYEDIGKSEWFKKAYEGKSLGCDYEQKEQKPIEPSDEEVQRYQNELYDFKVFATKQAKEHHISHVHDFEWNNFCAGLLSYFNEQKPEWSDEDSDNLERVDNYLWMLDDYVGDDCAMPQGKTDKIRGNIQEVLSPWLKSLPERFNLQPKQEWSEEDENNLHRVIRVLEDNDSDWKELSDWLKSLRPWKPNVEKLYYDRVNKEFYVKETINDPKSAIQELYKRLNKR